jgi:hypothetical protein
MRSKKLFAVLVLAIAATFNFVGTKALANEGTSTRVYTEEEVKLCVADCYAIFETPGAGLKQCVTKCLQLPRAPMRESSRLFSAPFSLPNFCETYEPGCEEGI